ncbi:MAG: hypothetical protein AAGC57_14880 [Pseudomonadota bacterium]
MTDAPALESYIAARLAEPVAPDIARIADTLMARPGAVAVLFYGASLREADNARRSNAGPLDFYYLVDPQAIGLLGRMLPPDVTFLPEGPYGAKVAVMSLEAFSHRMGRHGLDTTLWARFSQPTRLVRVRDPDTARAVACAIAEGVRTARWWTAHLVPDAGIEPLADWSALYAFTYGAELRVERGDARAVAVTASEPAWYRDLATLAPLQDAPENVRRPARRSWARRRLAGKLLNLARLAKAATTYSGGVAYAIAKVERHSGRPVVLSAWQRRWPALAAPLVLWRLWREGRLR